MYNFPELKEPLHNSRHQKVDMKELPYSEHADIERQCTNCRHGNLVPEICVPLFIKQWRGTYASVGIAVSIFVNHVIAEH
jgi:hypothetical protein